MTSGSSRGSEYQVSWSDTARESIKASVVKAREIRVGEHFLQIIKALDEKLRKDPLSLGEIRWHRGSVEGRIAIFEFVAIPFRVDKVKRYVLVRDCIAHFEGAV
jgi:hypothetical protein